MNNIDFRIAELETKLLNKSRNDDDSTSSIESSYSDNRNNDDSNNVKEGVITSLFDERIPKLSDKYLPVPMMSKRLHGGDSSIERINKKSKTNSKGQSVSFKDSGNNSNNSDIKIDKKEKKKRCKKDHDKDKDNPSSPSSFSPYSSSSGLEATVKELLQDYKPSSNERRPFWCRICMFQGKDVDDLAQHRDTELHKLAFEKERKLSYCKLCRKQFTSPDQLRKHVQGKPHKDKLVYFSNKQRSRS